MKCDNPTVRRQELGDQLRMHRTRAGFTLDDASRIIACSASKLSRIETGHRAAPIEEIASLLGLYRADHTQRTRLLTLAREAGETGWLQPHPAGCAQHRHALNTLESSADQIVHFGPILVPEALRTDEYAKAVLVESGAVSNDGLGDTTLHSTRARPRQPVQRLALLDESVLHRPFGGLDVLRGQLEHLRTTAAESHWTIRVIPRPRKITTGPFTLLRLPERPSVVHIEHLTCTLFLERPHDAAAYEQAVSCLEHNALDENASSELISRVTRNLET